MKYTYYVGEGPEAEALIKDIRRAGKSFRYEVDIILKDFPGNTGSVHSGDIGPVVGMAFAKELTATQCRDYGFNNKADFHEGSFFYYPSRRLNKGKALQKRFNLANKIRLSTKYISEVTGVLRILFEGNRLCSTSVGFDDNKIYIRIPGTPDDGKSNPYGGDKFPDIPDWFRAPVGDEFKFFLE